MHTYKLIWHDEIVDKDTRDTEYNDIVVPMTEHLRKKDEKYKIDCITFGPIPDFNIFDRVTLTAINENKTVVLSNSFDVFEDDRIEIFHPFKSSKLSLEKCTLKNKMIEYQVYFA